MISAVMAMALCVTSVNVSAVQSESEITKKNALMSDKQEIIENDDKSIDDEGREKPVVIKEIKFKHVPYEQRNEKNSILFRQHTL